MKIDTNILLIQDKLSLYSIYSAYLSEQPSQLTIANSLLGARRFPSERTPDLTLLEVARSILYRKKNTSKNNNKAGAAQVAA